MTDKSLFDHLEKWWLDNLRGGWNLVWRRKSVVFYQFVQKLGLHIEATAPLFWGDKMRVVTGEPVSQGILAFGYTEVAITALMLKILEPGQTLVDVGTHFGYISKLAWRIVGEAGYVYAFEPSPRSFAIAKKNLKQLTEGALRQEAVGDKTGTAVLQDRPLWQSAFNRITDDDDGFSGTKVNMTTLDDCFANRSTPIDFVKCDAEGSEMAVLKGATTILREDSPVLVLEADIPSPNGSHTERAFELARYLQRFDYQAFNFDFDGSFRFGPLNSFPVFHGNVAFVAESRASVTERLCNFK